ncbi:hypothetical protein ZIOFF_055668 [Zingiber officinale]|uniref:Uncharacterized protein n=1 Tax=Zingiber officinale TaxID=94328 RepID=A0A8J5KNR6_ZINOF|nr:hypothetical protein ZIOFF_055668 [Zingiber officinale]
MDDDFDMHMPSGEDSVDEGMMDLLDAVPTIKRTEAASIPLSRSSPAERSISSSTARTASVGLGFLAAETKPCRWTPSRGGWSVYEDLALVPRRGVCSGRNSRLFCFEEEGGARCSWTRCPFLRLIRILHLELVPVSVYFISR